MMFRLPRRADAGPILAPLSPPDTAADKQDAARLVPGAELGELRRLAYAARLAEFEAAKAKAIAALPEEPEYRVIQGRDGVWRAERRELSMYPERYEGHARLLGYGRIPLVPAEVGLVEAGWGWSSFTPTFDTEAQAKKWLRDYLKPPTPKVTGFDKEGNELPPA